MPSASTELQNLIIDRFGSLDDTPPREELIKKGYVLSRDWHWSHPTILSLGDMPKDDWVCLIFLCHEWDYGGLNAGARPTSSGSIPEEGEDKAV